jgi:hypothetical protein
MEGDQICGRPAPAGSARTRERMRQSLLHTEHVAPSRAASHSLLGMLAVQGLGCSDQSLPAPHAPTLALGERLLGTGDRGARAQRARHRPVSAAALLVGCQLQASLKLRWTERGSRKALP